MSVFYLLQILLTKLSFIGKNVLYFCFNIDFTFEIRVYKEWDESLRDTTSTSFKNFSTLIKKEVGYLTSYPRYARY